MVEKSLDCIISLLIFYRMNTETKPGGIAPSAFDAGLKLAGTT